MAKAQASGPAIFVARHGFSASGQIVPAGSTFVAGHPLLKGRMALVEPWQPTFGKLPSAEAAAEAPAKPAAAAAEEGGES